MAQSLHVREQPGVTGALARDCTDEDARDGFIKLADEYQARGRNAGRAGEHRCESRSD
ncbi:MAG TPA: hypothetical protein VKB08_19315 [Bradyrhizobium sp.]|nr:hypothetical protein [Bradyrhizobium sp.]